MYIPGLNVPGITGLLLIIIGIAITAKSLVEALIIIIIIITILGIILAFIVNSASKGRLSKSIVLQDSINGTSGNYEMSDLIYFLGKEGITTSILRPSGTAVFDGVKLDVISEEGYIPKDTKVKISKIKSLSIMVSKVENNNN